MWDCAECGTPQPDGKAFCGDCGTWPTLGDRIAMARELAPALPEDIAVPGLAGLENVDV